MLTPVDHWLRERFLFQTHIYTLRLPEKLPRGVRVRELPESPSNRYRYRILANTNATTDKLVTKLNEAGMMFSTQVVEKKTIFKPLIAPKKGSVLLNVFWMFSFFGLSLGVMKVFQTLTNDPVFMENFRETIIIFKG